MNYKKKQHLVEALTTTALSIGYVAFALGGSAPNGADLQAWGKAILVFLCTIALGNVAVQVVFHFLFSAAVAVEAGKRREEHLIERTIASFLRLDERDGQINHRAGYIASWCIGIGFVLSIAFLAFGGQPAIFLHILLAAFVLSSLADSMMHVVAYKGDGMDG